MREMTWTQKLFGFQGRITRLDFWLAQLFYLAAIFVAIYSLSYIARSVGDAEGSRYTLGGVMIIGYLFLAWSSLAVAIKRYHDRNKSGWWVLIALVPVIGGLWYLIEAGFLRGTSGPNQYGPDPLAA